MAYSTVLSVGGIHVTNDISIGLRTPIESAELIKKKYGCAVLDLVDPSEVVEVPSVGGRPPRKLLRQELTQIIEPRVAEMMEMVDRELVLSGKKEMLSAGIVLTGGGSMLDGSIEAAERVFNMPVRIGVPAGHRGTGGPGCDAAVRQRRGPAEIRPQDEPAQGRKARAGEGRIHVRQSEEVAGGIPVRRGTHGFVESAVAQPRLLQSQ